MSQKLSMSRQIGVCLNFLVLPVFPGKMTKILIFLENPVAIELAVAVVNLRWIRGYGSMVHQK